MGSSMGGYLSALKSQVTVGVGILLLVAVLSGCTARHLEDASPEGGAAVQSEAVGEAMPAMKHIQKIRLVPQKEQLAVWIEGSSPLEYTSIKQPFPFGVSVYLPNTRFVPEFVPETASDTRVSAIKTSYADKEETTVKVEILLTQDLPYKVQEDGERIGIILMGTPQATATPEVETLTDKGRIDSGAPEEMGAVVQETDISNETAEVTGIEFDTKPSGHSEIRVMTNHPIRYETRQVDQEQLALVLFNTNIAEHHQRPLLTRYFNSAVEKVVPDTISGNEKDARIIIRTRDQVPFRVVQTNAGIHMRFDPSTVSPPEFEKNKLDVVSGEDTYMAETKPVNLSSRSLAAVPEQGAVAVSQVASNPVKAPSLPGMEAPVYTGEKIKLDFYDTDIKNVFRILRSVSGKNFAVDSDVQGKVTLSLEEPVPWDQVLDLVLKMNGLGKKVEGNVIRIATTDSLTREEQTRQEVLAAAKKAAEQQVALEPLQTEYIPINYSDATADILPQVSLIITPDRGRVSVDSRTNTIIITDTQKKIDQAHDLIFRLDQVTPQIMIEARVVEVTKEFSRSFGLDWNLSNASGNTSGYIDDFNVSINEATTGIAGDFTFFRLFGSSMTALNAQLEASEELGDVRIVSSPRILTLDNKKAVIKQGQEYAYLERDDTGGSSVSYKEIELVLEVTPHVTPDKRISMTVNLKKDDVASFIQLQGDQVPVLSTNEAETELLINNNETVVIGGVVKTSQSNDDDGIPLLRGIPLLGYLFSTKAETDDRNELLIFITPSIVQLEQKRNTVSK
ncbi:MAG TPA: type IV pilus secretin PilQ [Desulfobacteraceae bacterium]|nr:type IV pilus secretin PilQ [Desulfobacteraceae bacterium]